MLQTRHQGIGRPDVDNALTTTTIEWDDDLRRGIWPRSAMIWIIAFWMMLLTIRPWESLIPSIAPLHVERTYALAALVVLFVSGQFRIVSSMQTTGLILWFVALAVSSALALQPSLSWDKLYVYMTVFLLFFVLVATIRTAYQLVFIVTCFIVSFGAFLAKSQWEYFLHGAHGFEMGVYRLKGLNQTYGHPNCVAGMAVISLPFWLFLWQSRREFTHSWPSSWRKAFGWALVLYFPLALSSIILTNSRTGIMGFVVFISFVILSGQNIGRVLVSLAGVLVLLGVTWMVIPEQNRHRIQTLWAPTEADSSAVASAEGRKVGFNMGMEMFRRFPATGVGLANFQYYRKSLLDGSNLVAHNTYGAVLGETGLVGGAAFAFFIVVIFRNASRTNRLAKVVPDPIVQLLARLTVACRRSTFLYLFVGIAGDYQAFAPLYWIAAYCLLAWYIATTISHRLGYEAFADGVQGRTDLWVPSLQLPNAG